MPYKTPRRFALVRTKESATATDKSYIGIRKVKWDEMWHVLFEHSDGSEDYDRVTKTEALEVLKKIEELEKPKKEPKRKPFCRFCNGTGIFRHYSPGMDSSWDGPCECREKDRKS